MDYCYEYGYGVKQNIKEALRLYHLAANQKCNEAFFCLGRCYEISIGVKENLSEAIKYYNKAIHYGNEEANEVLKRIYAKK